MTWDDLPFWSSGEWQVIQEKLDSCKYHPPREDMFAAMDECPLEETKVVIMGQDPYPESKYATGVAFSIPKTSTTFPPTLLNILKEYQDDLHYPMPTTGNLHRWSRQGVFLWNAVPVYLEQSSVSINTAWPEWACLNKDIILALYEKDVVFAFLGRKAQANADLIHDDRFVLRLSHPSPLASRHSRHPFLGSRMFTTINGMLVHLGKEPVNWRLG